VRLENTLLVLVVLYRLQIYNDVWMLIKDTVTIGYRSVHEITRV